MTLKNQIMKLQTYKMYEDEDTVYVERDDVLKALEQIELNPSEDAIAMDAIIEWLKNKDIIKLSSQEEIARKELKELLSVTPRNNLAETSQDCISREAVMEEFEQYGDNRNSKMYIDTIMDILANFPSVTPKGETITDFADRCRECGTIYGKLLKPKTGQWLHPYKSNVACECSVCHRQMPITNDFKFCPNCGTRMIEPQESERDD